MQRLALFFARNHGLNQWSQIAKNSGFLDIRIELSAFLEASVFGGLWGLQDASCFGFKNVIVSKCKSQLLSDYEYNFELF